MLLDTSGLLAIHHRDEHAHAEASELYRNARRRVTHSYVLAEFVALAHTRRLPREPALEFVADLSTNELIEFAWVDERLHSDALLLLQRQLDKSYSLCDAVSFIVMKERGITDALTTDRHFDQAGFKRLLPST